jgi:hypothetical protein
MVSRASISSEIRAAPISAVNEVPICAASATPATSGVISRVFAHEDTRPVKASAPIERSPWKPWSPTWVPVKNAIEKMTKNVPAPTTRAPTPIVMSEVISPICLR